MAKPIWRTSLNFGILGNNLRDKNGLFRKSVEELLYKKAINVLFNDEIFNDSLEIEKFAPQLDCVICIGGDGTFLYVARRFYRYKIPILGINHGNLGFLTNVERADTENAIDQILAGQYILEKRMMLEGSVYRNGKLLYKDTALNDIVIKNDINSKIIHVKTYYDNLLIDNYPGDGLIVCTPTGSTAYSLSCGGPIVDPNIDQIIITPICPHILFARSVVTSGDRTIRAIIDENEDFECVVKFDDKETFTLRGRDEIIYKKAESKVKIIAVAKVNFFDVLRYKLYSRG
ncbi:MAG TPA: NAD(+) kinase, partial [Clostridiales bacterium]|nr:NAD(+) kinase [Clostridiales bacterium]